MAPSDPAQDQAAPTNPLEYATPLDDRARTAIHLNPSLLILAAAFILLTAASLWVMLSSAEDEPYFGTIRKSDAVEQVGLGCVLIAFWTCWCVALLALALRRKVHPAWCAALLWAGFATFALAKCVDGYLSDLITFQSTPSLWAGWQRSGPPAPAPTPSPPTTAHDPPGEPRARDPGPNQQSPRLHPTRESAG